MQGILNFCTLFDKYYLPRGLALYKSLVKNCPNFVLWVLCMDKETYRILKKMNFKFVKLISLGDFEDKGLKKIKSTRSWGEYCWTCTPSLPLYLLKTHRLIKSVAYLDSDLYFYSDPRPVYKEMGKDSVLIIPHRFVPWRKYKEINNGIFNVSMLIFKNNKNGIKVLEWWRKKCLEWCYHKVEDNKMGDQKYLDEFPKLFKGVHILNHLGAGVAHWNVSQYNVSRAPNGKYLINGFPLIFYHYQGFEIYKNCLLPWGPYNVYPRNSMYGEILYKDYYNEMVRQISEVRKINRKWSFPYAKKPPYMIIVKDWLISSVK